MTGRFAAGLRLLGGLAAEVVVLSLRSIIDAANPRHHSTPAILELPLRLRTPGELSAMAMSIAITPGSLVLGTALPEEGVPARMYVHVLNSRGRSIELAALHRLEDRILTCTRGRKDLS